MTLRETRYRTFSHGCCRYPTMRKADYGVPTAAVKKTISLPPELAREAEETARAGKALSDVSQDALRLSRAERLKRELKGAQHYWSWKARESPVPW
jgi:hypothetical protein